MLSECVQKQIFREINGLYEYVDYLKSGCCIGSQLEFLDCLKVAIRSIGDFQNNKRYICSSDLMYLCLCNATGSLLGHRNGYNIPNFCSQR